VFVPSCRLQCEVFESLCVNLSGAPFNCSALVVFVPSCRLQCEVFESLCVNLSGAPFNESYCCPSAADQRAFFTLLLYSAAFRIELQWSRLAMLGNLVLQYRLFYSLKFRSSGEKRRYFTVSSRHSCLVQISGPWVVSSTSCSACGSPSGPRTSRTLQRR
jgi:hypothetical protein